MLKRSHGFMIVFLFLGCATSSGPQAPAAPERVTVVTAGLGAMEVRTVAEGAGSYWTDYPVEQVWAVLPQVYEELGVPLAVNDSVTKRIGNPRFRPRRVGGSRLSQYLRCGNSVTATPNADRYQVTLSLTTQLTDAGEGSTNIVTMVSATASPRDVGGTDVNCGSTGRLEERISEMVGALLSRPTPNS